MRLLLALRTFQGLPSEGPRGIVYRGAQITTTNARALELLKPPARVQDLGPVEGEDTTAAAPVVPGSVYAVWLAQEGNAGKTEAQFLEAMRGAPGTVLVPQVRRERHTSGGRTRSLLKLTGYSPPASGPMPADGLYIADGSYTTDPEQAADIQGDPGVTTVMTEEQIVEVQGPAGDPGVDGKTTYQRALELGLTTLDEEAWIASLKGDAGPDGPVGPAGETGPAGPVGPEGAAGARGPAGPTGPAGDPGQPGPQGDRGPPGAQGPTGDRGVQGLEGPAGPAGSPGAKGDTGPAGAKGDTGAQGPKGDAGSQGPAGAAGAPGAAGAKGDTGATGAAGASWVNLPNITVAETAVIAILAGIRKVAVACAGAVVGDPVIVFPMTSQLNGGSAVNGTPAGYAVQDACVTAANVVTVTVTCPAIALGASYSIACKVKAFR
jgi:hypothetical protein